MLRYNSIIVSSVAISPKKNHLKKFKNNEKIKAESQLQLRLKKRIILGNSNEKHSQLLLND